jgi:hypothetical protein
MSNQLNDAGGKDLEADSQSEPAKTLPRPSSVVYIIAILMLSVAALLTIWPTSNIAPTWLSSVSAELRYLLVVVSGSALGTIVRVILALADVKRPGKTDNQSVLLYFLGLLWAVPLSVLFYLVLRGVLLSPAAATSNLNPFGILLYGFLTGVFADTALKKLNAMSRALFSTDPHLEERIDRISEALGVTSLDNYRGALYAEITQEGPKIVISQEGRYALQSNSHYDLLAWFQPTTSPRLSRATAQEIRITGGTDASRVEFLVTPDSDADITFVPRQQSLSFDPQKHSPRIEFQFSSPVMLATYRLWIRVTQKNRLVAVLTLELCLQESTSP